MTDYTGLKRLCAALISANEAYLHDDCSSEKQERFHAADDALQDALPPEVVLAIIAENELLRESPGMRAIRSLRGDCADLMAERDQLKAENERLQSAARTLGRLRYTDNGAELWKPPLGEKPDFSLIDQLNAEVDSLTREADRQYTTIEAYRKDAERYQWLRENAQQDVDGWRNEIPVLVHAMSHAPEWKTRIDESIDAAMRKAVQS